MMCVRYASVKFCLSLSNQSVYSVGDTRACGTTDDAGLRAGAKFDSRLKNGSEK